jgi:hypothetical protein
MNPRNLSVRVCRVETPEGTKDYVTCSPRPNLFTSGLAPEEIVGVLQRPLRTGEAITPTIFARNRVFVEFMQSVIAHRGPTVRGLIARANQQGEGWVLVIDQRTPTPTGAVPPEDIVGAFAVNRGALVPGSYKPNPNHALLTGNGFFQLGDELQECLLEALAGLKR